MDDLDFTKVTYDDDLEDLSEDELRQTVSEFENAQESNVAEFEKAADALDVDEKTIEDFESAKQGLIEDITEAEDFDKVPLTEEKLESEDFSDLQEWQEFVAGEATDDGSDGADGGGDGDFDDMGQKSPTDLGDDDEEFVEEQLGDMPGFSL